MIMATVTRTVLVNDLNGSTDDVSTVQFTLDRTHYEIELSADNQARLQDKLARSSAPPRPSDPSPPTPW
jgi:hypothetical protein